MPKFARVRPLPSDVRGRGALRRALVSGAASALLVGLAVSADAAPRGGFFSPYGSYGYYSYPAPVPSRRLRAAPARRERAEPKKEVGFGELPKGPLQIVVSIDHQRVTLFSNGVRVAQGPVSTGVPEHPTPIGVFSIIEKDRYHRSNLYSNAPMPFMQRITWSGVALHEGVLPGYPASHGCIRMSQDFAQKLWPTTKLGARVIVARGELAPVDFEHPKLFVPKPKPGEPEIAVNATTDGYGAAPITMAQATTPDAREVAPATAQPRASERALPAATLSNPRSRSIRPSRSRRACGRRAAGQAKRSGGGLRQPQGNEDLRPAGLRAAVRYAGRDRRTRSTARHSRPHRNGGDRQRHAVDSMTIPTDPSAPVDQRDYGRKRSKEPSRPAMQLKPPSTAAEALNRIAMPKEVVDRISELLIPGSSLVIADEGLGRETGRYTEFIVLSH